MKCMNTDRMTHPLNHQHNRYSSDLLLDIYDAMLENPPQRIEGDSAHSTVIYNTTTSSGVGQQQRRRRRRRALTKRSDTNILERDTELSRVVTITVREEYMDWIQERSYVPDVAIVLDREDRYVKWLFEKLQKVDVTRSVRRVANEDSGNSIPDDVVSWIRKGSKCRRFKPKSSGSRNRCHGLRFCIRVIRPEEGVGKSTKWYVVTPLNIEWSGCPHCEKITSRRVRSYLESRTFCEKVRSFARRNTCLVEKMSCLDQRASEGRGNVHDVQTLRPIKGRVLLDYVEDYVRNNNITEDPEYAVKLGGGASFSERFQAGPMGAFDVIKRARKQQLGQSLARDSNFKKVLNSSSTPTSVGEEWWLSHVRGCIHLLSNTYEQHCLSLTSYHCTLVCITHQDRSNHFKAVLNLEHTNTNARTTGPRQA